MKTVLVIEDDKSTLAYIQKILNKTDYEVLTATNGQEGLQLAKERFPNLILCDIMMPYVDGFKVLQELKASSDTEWIPLVFLSALVDRQNIRQGMNLGADDYLTKPFERKELLGMINAQFKKQDRISRKIEVKVKEIFEKVENNEISLEAIIDEESDILIVDDNEINTKILENFLIKTGIPYRKALNGHEAIAQVLLKKPGVILLDIMMPVMDGTDTIRVIRKNKEWNNIHIIIASSINFEDEIIKLIQMGANDYLLKPIKYNYLAGKLQKTEAFRKYFVSKKSSFTD